MNSRFEIRKGLILYRGTELKKYELSGKFLLQPLNPRNCLDCPTQIALLCLQNETLPNTPAQASGLQN
ncbi:MAG: hypothetical protein UT14_C0050G0007 [Candidatus Shapirobacteria bacterium GW2011_GWE1_38_92]|uniref:Uncharacterized protein n=1 Tax=Candidatus Shapirobacteria bacterium GW2011_GWE1_38_92 TaxID=1618489 RepID=A0A0G0PKN4_9BACT|nr:MAG: hypothetical protein UT14_C0050G0007 [Candidatus Shapirobacteria bacterium GW2011_GWE1_38_92]